MPSKSQNYPLKNAATAKKKDSASAAERLDISVPIAPPSHPNQRNPPLKRYNVLLKKKFPPSLS